MDKVINYIRDSIDEIKRVQWPTRQQTIRLTGYVIGVSLGIALFVALFDYIFKELLSLLINK